MTNRPCPVCGEISEVEQHSCAFCQNNMNQQQQVLVTLDMFPNECPACGGKLDSEKKYCPLCRKQSGDPAANFSR